MIKIEHDDIIHPGQRMFIKGEGMPNLQDNLVKGDLIIIFDVVFPQSLDKDRSKYLVKILPSPKKQIWDLQMENIPETELTIHKLEPFNDNTYTQNQQASRSRQSGQNGQSSQNDFHMDDEPHMGPVECTTQ